MKHGVALAAALAAAWFLWSGHTKPLILGLGAVSVALVLWIVRRMGRFDGEVAPLGYLPGALRYLPWLLWQIVVSNVQVARIVLGPRLKIAPRVFRHRVSQRTDVGRVIYANSITLTPGTVSVYLENGVIQVHALTQSGADDILSGAMDARVTRLER